MNTQKLVFSRLFDKGGYNRTELSLKKKVSLALIDEIKNLNDEMDSLQYIGSYSEFQNAYKDLEVALNDAKENADILKNSFVDSFGNTDWQSMVEKAEDVLERYKNAANELGIDLGDDAELLEKYLNDWYSVADIYNELPDAESLIASVSSIN